MRIFVFMFFVVFFSSNDAKSLTTFEEMQKILAGDAQAADNFGCSVSISGNYAVVGASEEDAGGTNAGAAYFFEFNNGTWTQMNKVIASDAQTEDKFGFSVSISGNNAVIGAYNEDSGGNNAGAAYFFRLNSGTWTEVNKVTASDAQNFDFFGVSVSISGNYSIIGASNKSVGGNYIGAAYFFKLDGGIWSEVNSVTASDAQDGDNFGNSVSISGTNAIVGASYEDEGGTNAGAAYFFELDGGTWSEINKVTASDAQSEDKFGESVSISGNYSIIGALFEDEGGINAGAAYFFKLDGGTWTEVNKVTASDAQAEDRFGFSVSISGSYAIIGALDEDEGGGDAGAAYFFKLDGGTWSEVNKVTASDAQAEDKFGESVSISGNYSIIGALFEDEDSINAGAAYFFEKITETSPSAYTPSFSNITRSSASYSVEVADGGASTTVTFEYGTVSGNYSATTTSQTITGASTTSTVNFNVTGLDANEQYFVKARAENSVSFSYSTEASFWTLTGEPTTHTNSFAQIGEANNSITFSFQSLNTISADGYILLRSSGNIENPVDGTTYSVNDNIGSTVVVGIITDANATDFVLNNQQFQKSYTFKLVPFNVGDDPATTNYFITDAPTINAYTIPTLGEWGMMAFVGLMAIGGVFFVRKRIV